MSELQKIAKKQLDKINAIPKVKCLKNELELKILEKCPINCIKNTFVRLFKLLTAEVLKIQHKFMRANTPGTVVLYFTDNKAQIFFSNSLDINSTGIINSNTDITPEQLNQIFENFMDGDANFPEEIQTSLTKKVIKCKSIKWKDIEIPQNNENPLLFSSRYTPATLSSSAKLA